MLHIYEHAEITEKYSIITDIYYIFIVFSFSKEDRNMYPFYIFFLKALCMSEKTCIIMVKYTQNYKLITKKSSLSYFYIL